MITIELTNRERLVCCLWELMRTHHGDRWANAFGPLWDEKREQERKTRLHLARRLSSAARVWADRLADIDPNAVAEAADSFAHPGIEELPTLPEFIARCGQVAVGEKEQQQTNEQRQDCGTHGRQQIEQLRSMLVGRDSGTARRGVAR